jgi:hypothetical protein
VGLQLKTLKELILNVIDLNPRGFSNQLAEISGYSSGSNLKKVLTDSKKEFDSFKSLLKLIKYLWNNESVSMMVKYSKEIDPNKKTARNMLEYLATNRQFDAFNNLLDRMDQCTNKESLEYSKVYRMQYKYELSQTVEDYNQLLKEIDRIHVTFTEMKIYKKMLMNYCFDQKQDYGMTKFLLEEITDEVEQIENEYIREMYMIRLNEVKSYTFLRVYDKPELARKSADWIINSSARIGFKAYAYFIKGQSYLFTSLENLIVNLNKGVELYEKMGRERESEDLKEKIEFAKIYWDQFKNEKCKYIINDLFLRMKNGEDVSKELNDVELFPEFRCFYEGYNAKDNKKLLLSLIKFIKKNNLFLANLAKIELLKNGYDEEIISEMVSMNIA